MTGPSVIAYIGAACFGLVAGYITYRTLTRAEKAAVSDIATVLAAIGGGAVVKLYDDHGDLFGAYATALPFGMILYIAILAWMKGGPAESARREISLVLSGGDIARPDGSAAAGNSGDYTSRDQQSDSAVRG